MRTPEQVEQLVRSAFAGSLVSFAPVLTLMTRWICIRVVARDCSVTETRVNNLITVLESTYPRRAQMCWIYPKRSNPLLPRTWLEPWNSYQVSVY